MQARPERKGLLVIVVHGMVGGGGSRHRQAVLVHETLAVVECLWYCNQNQVAQEQETQKCLAVALHAAPIQLEQAHWGRRSTGCNQVDSAEMDALVNSYNTNTWVLLMGR